MKESEIKRAIEKIDWALLGVLDTVSRYEDILTMHLEKTSKETEDALQLVKDLCDFMIDDGSIDLSKVLQRIFDECMDINCGKHGDIKDGVLTEERQDIVDRILFNVSSICWEIQCYWNYINAPQSTIIDGMGQQGENTKKKERKCHKNTFEDIVQYSKVEDGEDIGKKLVLERLHYLIDGKTGKAVGLVIRKAWIDKLITDFPTMDTFKTEFVINTDNGKGEKSNWEAIRKYFGREKIEYDIKANDIIILN